MEAESFENPGEYDDINDRLTELIDFPETAGFGVRTVSNMSSRFSRNWSYNAPFFPSFGVMVCSSRLNNMVDDVVELDEDDGSGGGGGGGGDLDSLERRSSALDAFAADDDGMGGGGGGGGGRSRGTNDWYYMVGQWHMMQGFVEGTVLWNSLKSWKTHFSLLSVPDGMMMPSQLTASLKYTMSRSSAHLKAQTKDKRVSFNLLSRPWYRTFGDAGLFDADRWAAQQAGIHAMQQRAVTQASLDDDVAAAAAAPAGDDADAALDGAGAAAAGAGALSDEEMNEALMAAPVPSENDVAHFVDVGGEAYYTGKNNTSGFSGGARVGWTIADVQVIATSKLTSKLNATFGFVHTLFGMPSFLVAYRSMVNLRDAAKSKLSLGCGWEINPMLSFKAKLDTATGFGVNFKLPFILPPMGASTIGLGVNYRHQGEEEERGWGGGVHIDWM